MSHKTKESRKSSVKPTYNPPHGINVEVGQRIIFEYDGELWEGPCMGFNCANEPLVKTDLWAEPACERVRVPVDRVWFVRDARDDVIENLEKGKANGHST